MAKFAIESDAGKVAVLVISEIPDYKVAKEILTNVKINKLPLTGKAGKLTTTYNSGKTISITLSKK